MEISPSIANILKTEIVTQICSTQCAELLLSGNFYQFEEQLHALILSLYDNICEELINQVSSTTDFFNMQHSVAETLGLKKLELRPASIQLRTGTKVTYPSLYAKQAPLDYIGNRHLSSVIWQSESGCSPIYQSISCLFSVLCPSFEVAKSLLNYQNISANSDRIRSAALSLSEKCMAQRASIQLAPKESLAGKRVVIGMDGGRTRTRVYEGDKKGRAEKFSTPWREPKMFVITTCNEQGKINEETLPIYDGTYGDDETFDLLAAYLTQLQVDKAESVQFLADGAPWIWNRVKPVLLRLGVEETKIIETLDYYHAMEHLHSMKVYFSQGEQDSYFKKLKEALWQGDFTLMTQLIKEGIKGIDLEEFNPFKYFRKQQYRIDYQSLKEDNRPCGSGIIESAIRRIINLRFKSPSSFWYPENAEKLTFMRGVVLAGRWDIMMKNLFF